MQTILLERKTDTKLITVVVDSTKEQLFIKLFSRNNNKLLKCIELPYILRSKALENKTLLELHKFAIKNQITEQSETCCPRSSENLLLMTVNANANASTSGLDGGIL